MISFVIDEASEDDDNGDVISSAEEDSDDNWGVGDVVGLPAAVRADVVVTAAANVCTNSDLLAEICSKIL